MITLYADFDKPISQKYYDFLINQLQIHQLKCSCGIAGCLTIHGYYKRYVKGADTPVLLRVLRLRCSYCGKTHAILLSTMVPYVQHTLEVHVGVIENAESGASPDAVLEKYPSLDESSYRYIIRKYISRWKQRLESAAIEMQYTFELVRQCFRHYSKQFMQIKCTSNRLFITNHIA